MKKIKVFSTALLFLFTTSISWAEIDKPSMLVPANHATISQNNDLMFVWGKVKSAKKYRVVISTEGDFSNYDMENHVCTEKSNKCLVYSQLGSSLKISKTKGLTKNEGVEYFWFVQAIGKSESSLVDDAYAFTIEKPAIRYSKIANDGSKLPDTAKLGKGLKDWACTKDEKTGLLWEIKTTDGGLRDVSHTYSNYSLGYDPEEAYKSETNAFGFVTAVNKDSLCGKTSWRLPSSAELSSMFSCPSGLDPVGSEYDYSCSVGSRYFSDSYFSESPTKNKTYFLNSISSDYWSSTVVSGWENLGSTVNFSNGYWDNTGRKNFYPVRLVSDGD